MTKADIVKELQKKGLSRRDAEKILDHVIEWMKEALVKGEEVEIPFGVLKVIKYNREQRGWYLGKIRKLYKQPLTVKLIRR